MIPRYEEVKNFPSKTPLYKKVWANMLAFFGWFSLKSHRNFLSRKDALLIRLKLRKWDILLVGDLRALSATFIPWPVTHALVAVGKGRCVHAIARGVSFLSLQDLLRHYDTCVIMRPHFVAQQRKDFIETVYSHVGKPYDFDFGASAESFFCTKLVNEALRDVGYDSWLESVRWARGDIEKILWESFTAHRALLPADMIRGNFRLIFLSHNLVYTTGNLTLKT